MRFPADQGSLCGLGRWWSMILPTSTTLTLAFLGLALLAALIAALGAQKRGLDAEAALRFGATLFLGQLALFLLGQAIAMPSPIAYGMALAAGSIGTLEQRGPEET